MKLKFIAIGIFAALSTMVIQAQSHLKFSNPEVEVFLPHPDKADGRAVVICPGGGYTVLASDYEGTDWSQFFNDRGIAVAVVNYRMPEGNPAIPMDDVKSTIEILCANSDKWNINPDKIGVMGSSAGGHLATLVATDTTTVRRTYFQILCYPVISMVDDNLTHRHSRNKLLGSDFNESLAKQYSSEYRVTPETPRAYIAFSDDDDGVSPLNGLVYYTALHNNGVPASLFIYPTGGHGWGYKPFTYRNEMLADLSAWLSSF